MTRNSLHPGTRCIDARNPTERGVLVSWSKCGRYGVVKFAGRKANIVPIRELRRGPHA